MFQPNIGFVSETAFVYPTTVNTAALEPFIRIGYDVWCHVL